jgi:hypothetical protein
MSSHNFAPFGIGQRISAVLLLPRESGVNRTDLRLQIADLRFQFSEAYDSI